MKKNKKKMFWGAFTGFVLLGLTNSVILHHESHMSGSLVVVEDFQEMEKHNQTGRVLATKSQWEKVAPTEVAQADSSPMVEDTISAAIENELTLNLVEVINPKLWSKGISSSQFTGDLKTANGTIEALTIKLPAHDEISISYAEMTGNVFQYDYSGEIYSGMLYQIDPKSYMVTFTNGPLEGTRMRFMEEFSDEQIEIQDTLKEEHNIEVGFFGDHKDQAESEEKPTVDPAILDSQIAHMGAQV